MGPKKFFTAYIESEELSNLGHSWYSVSGKIGDQKFSVGSLQNVDGQIIESSFGSMELAVSVSEQLFRIASPSSELQLELDMTIE